MKTRTELKLTVGAQYRLGSYQSDGECGLIEIERIEPAENGWYDDHQGGGWDSPGMIYYRYVDLAHKTRGDGTGHAWDACEYARDN